MARTHRSESKERTGRKKRRARPTPRWLMKQADLDGIARARVLMVLSVLSGEKPVTTAIEELGISRGFYYQLETKALNAMLLSLAPGSDGSAAPDATGTSRRITELEEKVSRLEQEKRRAERLLLLTRKALPPSAVKIPGKGRPPKVRGSAGGGRAPSPGSRRSTRLTTTGPAAPASPPTSAGGTEGR
jgi:hypothetical protein